MIMFIFTYYLENIKTFTYLTNTEMFNAKLIDWLIIVVYLFTRSLFIRLF